MYIRACIGASFLVALAAGIFIAAENTPGSHTLARRLGDHITGRRDAFEVRFEAAVDLRPGDPVFTVEKESFARQGTVTAVDESQTRITISLDPMVQRSCTGIEGAIAMNPRGNLAWMVRTLVPPDLRERMKRDLAELWEQQRDQTLAALEPALLRVLGDLTRILADTFPDVLQEHEDLVQEFVRALREDIFESELRPMLDKEVLSRLETRLTPVAAEIGNAVWNAVSTRDLMGILWTATRGSVGLGNNDEMAERLSTLLEKKAVPVIRARGGEVLAAAIAALQEAAVQPEVRAALDAAAWKTVQHPTFQELIATLSQSWIVENEALRKRALAVLDDAAIRAPLDRLFRAAEPRLQASLRDMLSRADEQGMDHQLVRVLRRMVLFKDQRYLLLERKAGSERRLQSGIPLRGIRGEDP